MGAGIRIGVVTSPDRSERYRSVPGGVLAPTTTLDPIELRGGGGFPADELDLRLKELLYVDAGVKAAAGGCDALVVNTFCDYGLGALRAATRVPVVGAGQAAMHLALGLGRRFSVVTVWPRSTAPLYRRLLVDYELVPRCASIRHVHTDEELAERGTATMMADVEAHRGEVLDRIRQEVGAAVDEDGADVVVLGCCCMTGATDELRRTTSVPVVDPFSAACRAAETAAVLGVTQSQVTYGATPLRRLRDVSAAVGALVAPDDDECEVCVV